MSTVMRPSLPQPHVMLRIGPIRSEEHTSELQSRSDLVCRLLLEKKKNHSLEKQRVLKPAAGRSSVLKTYRFLFTVLVSHSHRINKAIDHLPNMSLSHPSKHATTS